MDIFRTLFGWLTPDPSPICEIRLPMSPNGIDRMQEYYAFRQAPDPRPSPCNSQQNAWPDILTGNAYLHPAEYRSAERDPYVWRSTTEFD